MKLAKRILSIQPSPTLAISAKAKALKAKGLPIIDLGVGEPDFDTPQKIKESAIQAILEGWTKYTPSGGFPELKNVICEKLRRENKVEYDPSEIIVSCGAKHSLFNICQVLFEEGDEVIIPAPYWVSYVDQVVFHGATPVILSTRMEDQFLLNPQELERHIGPKTRALIINTPSNPTGAAYPKDKLEAIAEIALRHQLLIISDEIYEKITYNGFNHVSLSSLSPAIKSQTLLVNGVSKSFAMTGWRIGYTAGPSNIIQAMDNIQSQSTSNPTSISQKAAITALQGSSEGINEMVKEFDRRRRFGVEQLNQIRGVVCFNPPGAFYLFPDVSKYLGRSFQGKKMNNSSDLVEFLLENAQIALVPGEAFGAPKHIRISYATSLENLKEALKRLEQSLSKLS
ncbi:MAG TPA: pyridoxal phosphate-dependent aminotransferase [Nitrospiria bacterium]|jgi:aspartate aminotransferase